MENDVYFNLQEQIINWLNKLKTESSVTEADVEELKNHLLDSMEKLKKTGLDDEEAFWVASKRMGTISDWGEAFRQENNNIIQVRRCTIILAGVLCYFFFYHFLGFTSKILFIGLLKYSDNGEFSMTWLIRYFVFAHFLLISFITGILIFERKIINFIDKLRIRPRHTIYLLLITFIFGIINTSMMAVVKNLIRENFYLRDQFIHYNIYIDYSFPLIICIGFVLLYYRYYKASKIK